MISDNLNLCECVSKIINDYDKIYKTIQVGDVVTWTVFPVSGVIPSIVRMISKVLSAMVLALIS